MKKIKSYLIILTMLIVSTTLTQAVPAEKTTSEKTIVVQKAPKIKAKVSKTKATISWGKVKDKNITKVQLQISNSSKFRKIVQKKIISVKNTKAIVNLPAGRTYYARTRYVGKNGKFSKWSNTKKFTIKGTAGEDTPTPTPIPDPTSALPDETESLPDETETPTSIPETEVSTPIPETEAPPSSSSSYVYISETGSKYHSISNCGRMNPAKASMITEDEAIRRGYSKCSKCF